MRITIEQTECSNSRQVVIYEKYDDQNIDDIMDMVRAAIMAIGYTPETVNGYFYDKGED